ncbi:MAG: hypothetical protein Q8P65_01085 [bacterium]|nr:hypothetical protein [bacterium]
MKKTIKFNKQYLEYLASLSLLSLSKKENISLVKKLEDTKEYIDNINKETTNNIQPTYQVGNLKNVYFKDGETNKRQLNQTEVFKNTKNKFKNYFSTKKII